MFVFIIVAAAQTIQLLWLLFRSCHDSVTGNHHWSFGLTYRAPHPHWECQTVALSLRYFIISFSDNWLQDWTTSCWRGKKLWLQGFLPGGDWRMHWLPGWAGWGSLRSTGGFPSISLSVFLSLTYIRFSLWLHSIFFRLHSIFFLACLPRQWMANLPSPKQNVKSHRLSCRKKIKCLSQLLGRKRFGGALGYWYSCGLILLTGSIMCSAILTLPLITYWIWHSVAAIIFI